MRPFQLSDLPHVQRYAVRPEFYRYIPIPAQTAETVETFLQKLIDSQRNGNLTFAIEPLGIGHVIGAIRIAVRDGTDRQGDVGFGLDSEFQRQGYMTEALMCVLSFGFEELDLHRIWATADNKKREILETHGAGRHDTRGIASARQTRSRWVERFLRLRDFGTRMANSA